MPKFLARENSRAVPSASLWLSNGVIQVLLILTLFSDDAFTTLIKLTSTMVLVPYLLSALYAVKVVLAERGAGAALLWSAVATGFAALMVVAAGLQFLLHSALFYAPATGLYAVARREQGAKVFAGIEWMVFAVLLVAAGAGSYGLATGAIAI